MWVLRFARQFLSVANPFTQHRPIAGAAYRAPRGTARNGTRAAVMMMATKALPLMAGQATTRQRSTPTPAFHVSMVSCCQIHRFIDQARPPWHAPELCPCLPACRASIGAAGDHRSAGMPHLPTAPTGHHSLGQGALSRPAMHSAHNSEPVLVERPAMLTVLCHVAQLPGFCAWPGVVWSLDHCRTLEVPDVLMSFTAGQ